MNTHRFRQNATLTFAVAVLSLAATAFPAPAEAVGATNHAVTTLAPTQLGHLTWSFAATPPADKIDSITAAMNTAVGQTNTVAKYSGNVSVTYNSGVSTAQASYGGLIEFGGDISAGVALHELGHWFGSGTYWDFQNHAAGGIWTGAVATSRERQYDGASAVLHTDGTHFWPYGWNFPNEYSDPQREIGLVAGQRADMGLSDGMAAASGTFALSNRTNNLVVDTGASSNSVVQHSRSSNTGQNWNLQPANGYWSLTNARTGRVLDSAGRTTDGSTVITKLKNNRSAQQWEIIPTDGGYFQLRNRATGLCLDTGARGAGATLQGWRCGGWIYNQQWHLNK